MLETLSGNNVLVGSGEDRFPSARKPLREIRIL